MDDGKININIKIFEITNKCNEQIQQDYLSYEEFETLFKNKNINDIDFKKEKI